MGEHLAAAVACMVIDLGLPFGHAVGVLPQGGILPFCGFGRLETEKVDQFVAVREIGVQAHLDNGAECFVELFELLGLLLCEGIEPSDNFAGEDLANLGHDRAGLHHLARNIQRKVFGIDHSAHESQVFRQKVATLVLNEHLFHVKLRAVLFERALLIEQLHRGFGGNEKQCLETDRTFDRNVQVIERLLEVVRNELVELVHLLLFQLAFRALPERADAVYLATAEKYRVVDEVGVLPDDMLQSGLLGKLPELLLERKGDLRTA